MTAQLTGHVRDHRSLLAAAETRALVWIAGRLPQWISSDQLSAVGLVSMAVAGACFAAWPAAGWAGPGIIAALGLNWFGDSLDGTLARVRNQQRPRYGYYVDHVIDLAGTSFLLGGLAVSGLMSPLVAVAVLAGYVLVCAETYLATHVTRVFTMSFLGFGPTELRIVLGAGVLKAMSTPWIDMVFIGPVRLFDIGGVVAAAGLTMAFCVNAVHNARRLYREEPLPHAAVESRAA
jgi:archaetidylinositol phosphate synthase